MILVKLDVPNPDETPTLFLLDFETIRPLAPLFDEHRYWIGVDNSLGATRYLQITWKKVTCTTARAHQRIVKLR